MNEEEEEDDDEEACRCVGRLAPECLSHVRIKVWVLPSHPEQSVKGFGIGLSVALRLCWSISIIPNYTSVSFADFCNFLSSGSGMSARRSVSSGSHLRGEDGGRRGRGGLLVWSMTAIHQCYMLRRMRNL